jgi:hypothetical protein
LVGWQAPAHHPRTYDKFAGLRLGGTRHAPQQRHGKGDDDGKSTPISSAEEAVIAIAV